MSKNNFSNRVLQQVADERYRPTDLRGLAGNLNISDEQYEEFCEEVEALHRAGRVVIGEGLMVMPPDWDGKIIGTYRANRRGFGFVIPQAASSYGDMFIPPGKQSTAITGDTVLTQVLKRGKRAGKMSYEGKIVKILERGRSQFVGRLHNTEGRWLVEADGSTLHAPIHIPDAKASGAKSNAQVVVELIQYPSARNEAQGVIIEVLGKHGDSSIDTISIIKQYHLPREFPDACTLEARKAAKMNDLEHLVSKRLDLRDQIIITIDPDDAKDFDDAISLSRTSSGWELGVHIADVCHFVKRKSAIDKEAKLRGNSVYFPGQVIPMLPEVLSNGVCSLQEGVDRLTKSAFISYDAQGVVQQERACNSVIRSSKRLTYREASLILDGKVGGFAAEVVTLLKEMERLALIIQSRRHNQGMITLDLPGVELKLDDSGKLIDVQPEDQSFSHTIIEMFMIEANEAVARLLKKVGIPNLRRIHPQPDAEAGIQLTTFLSARGHVLGGNLNRKRIQKLLEAAKGKPESYCANLAVLRSMQQAVYSPRDIGHYALASEDYVHFTSPIRRYPDLTIHRLLESYQAGQLETTAARKGGKAHGWAHPSSLALGQLGDQCSFTERRAESAERELKMIKILRLLSDHLGDTFAGVVAGVADFGVFVQLEKYLIEGLIRVEHLPQDEWDVSKETGCLVGRQSGRELTIGDALRVTIVRADVSARQLDLRLSDDSTFPRKRTRKKSAKKPTKRSTTPRRTKRGKKSTPKRPRRRR